MKHVLIHVVMFQWPHFNKIWNLSSQISCLMSCWSWCHQSFILTFHVLTIVFWKLKKKTNDCWLTCFKAIICFNSQCKYLAKSLHSNYDLDSEELKHTKVLTLGSPPLKFGYQPKKIAYPKTIYQKVRRTCMIGIGRRN